MCADRLMGLARRMERERIDDPLTHLLLAAAHEEVYKNAYQDDENLATDPARKPAIMATIVHILCECVIASRKAMESDPSNFRAREQFQSLQRRLEMHLHPLKADSS